MNNNQGKIHFVSKRTSLFSIAVLVYLLSAQSCHGCSDCSSNARVRREGGHAMGYGRGWIVSRSGQDSGDHNSEYKGVVGLSPDTVMHFSGRSGSAVGKDVVFGEGFAEGTGDKGTGISVKEGAISGHGIGAAIETGKDGHSTNDHRIHWNRFDSFNRDGNGGTIKTEFRGIAMASASMAKCYAMSYFLIFIIFLLFN